jgi:hypothetical protein
MGMRGTVVEFGGSQVVLVVRSVVVAASRIFFTRFFAATVFGHVTR